MKRLITFSLAATVITCSISHTSNQLKTVKKIIPIEKLWVHPKDINQFNVVVNKLEEITIAPYDNTKSYLIEADKNTHQVIITAIPFPPDYKGGNAVQYLESFFAFYQMCNILSDLFSSAPHAKNIILEKFISYSKKNEMLRKIETIKLVLRDKKTGTPCPRNSPLQENFYTTTNISNYIFPPISSQEYKETIKERQKQIKELISLEQNDNNKNYIIKIQPKPNYNVIRVGKEEIPSCYVPHFIKILRKSSLFLAAYAFNKSEKESQQQLI